MNIRFSKYNIFYEMSNFQGDEKRAVQYCIAH